MKGKLIPTDWIHSDYLEAWLKNFVKDGTCLNVCSGMSLIGDTRIDTNETSNRTEPGDLFNLNIPENSYDYVYCDPPFNYYVTGSNRYRWQQDLFRICKKALITRRTKNMVHLPSSRHEYYIAEDHRLNLTLIRIDYKAQPSFEMKRDND